MAEQGQQGGEMDGIGAAASQAYGEALEGGASPQEAFDAAWLAAAPIPSISPPCCPCSAILSPIFLS
jgi:hypothetical protein